LFVINKYNEVIQFTYNQYYLIEEYIQFQIIISFENIQFIIYLSLHILSIIRNIFLIENLIQHSYSNESFTNFISSLKTIKSQNYFKSIFPTILPSI
jgi:hypothetical protein